MGKLIPPNQKPNYAKLSPQNKIGAWYQYNRNLQSRGLPIVPLPKDLYPYGMNTNWIKHFPTTTISPNDSSYFRYTFPTVGTTIGPLPNTPPEATQRVEETQESPMQVDDDGPDIIPGTPQEPRIDILGMAESNKRQKTGNVTLDTGASGSVGSASSGGFGSDMGPVVSVDRPMNFNNSGGLRFKQVHRFTTKGVAYTPITDTDTFQLFMATPLANLPWDRPYMYMSPRDFNSLPPGSYAKSCSISVVCRNPQIGFETGGTTSETATLNHNKHYITAKGLTDRVLGVNKKLVFGTASTPMVPTSYSNQTHSDLAEAMYGYAQNDAAFNNHIPASIVGIDIELDSYFCMQNYTTAYVTANPQAQKPGWPSLIEHINEANMNPSVGTNILSASYKFSDAPLKPQLPGITVSPLGTHSFVTSNAGERKSTRSISNLPVLSAANTSEAYFPLSDSVNNYTPTTYTGLLERGYKHKKIAQSVPGWNDHQPSLHVAMKPIPKISGVIANRIATEWTTVNAFYEVTAEIDVGFRMPNHFTQGRGHNVEEWELRMGNDKVQNENLPIRFNHYNLV